MNGSDVDQTDLQHEASSGFVWPPVIYIIGAVLAAILYWIIALPFIPQSLVWPARIIAVLTIVTGTGIALAAEITFKKAGTAVRPDRPTSTIVSTGVYRWTRNPMYLGMSLCMTALALGLNSIWFLVALVVAIIAVTKLAIEPEEAYLERKFGDQYTRYKAMVRRWL